MLYNVGIIGITGKMGRRLSALLANDDCFNLVSGVNTQSTESDYEGVFKNNDIIIDFSNKDATERAVSYCLDNPKPYVIGTTALSEECLKGIDKVAQKAPVLQASNFSISVNLLAELVNRAAGVLSDADIDIVETHHKTKKDAPSGTALFLKKSIGDDARGVNVISRRCGNVVGEHVVSFFGLDEVLVLKHEAFNRDIFARGAIKVAKWLLNQPPGLYSMRDYICAQSM